MYLVGRTAENCTFHLFSAWSFSEWKRKCPRFPCLFVVLSYESIKGDISCSYPPLPVSSLQLAGLIFKPQHPVGVQMWSSYKVSARVTKILSQKTLALECTHRGPNWSLHILMFQHGNLSVTLCVYDVTRKLHGMCKCSSLNLEVKTVTIKRRVTGVICICFLQYCHRGVFWKLVEIISKLATLRLVIGHFAAFQKCKLPFEGQHRTQWITFKWTVFFFSFLSRR